MHCDQNTRLFKNVTKANEEVLLNVTNEAKLGEDVNNAV